jgi:hypothetical protein
MAIQLHVSAPYQFISVNAFVKYRQRQHKLANPKLGMLQEHQV